MKEKSRGGEGEGIMIYPAVHTVVPFPLSLYTVVCGLIR